MRTCLLYTSVEEYNALPESARAEYVLRFSLRYYPVLNLDQTDFEERFPEQWQKLLELSLIHISL